MTNYQPVPKDVEDTATIIVDAAYKIHRALGPVLYERVYEICMCHELRKRGLTVESQVDLPICYDGEIVPSSLRMDLMVNNSVIVEI